MPTPGNALNITQAGVVSFDGVSVFTGSPLTQFDVLAGGASNAITSIASGTTGQVLTSNGVGVLPTWQTGTSVTTGTWTPAIAFGGASSGVTYLVQSGYYTQIGNVVFINCYIQLNSSGSSTGNATIKGLPVSTGANGVNNAVLPFQSAVGFDSPYTTVALTFSNSSTALTIYEFGDGQTAQIMQQTSFGHLSLINFSAMYLTT